MTDLEALECIVVDLVPKAKEHNKEEIEQVKKRLEVLEIVKTHKLLNYVIKNEKCAKMYNLTEKEINKIKEWLNDK